MTQEAYHPSSVYSREEGFRGVSVPREGRLQGLGSLEQHGTKTHMDTAVVTSPRTHRDNSNGF